MAIVCGTELNEFSSNVIVAAAQLAKRLETTLHLVHSIDRGDHEPTEALAKWAEGHLRSEAEGLRTFGTLIETHVKLSPPDEALLAVATEVSASLIVVGASGRRGRGKGSLGSHADRLAQRSHVPVLVVRGNELLSGWNTGDRPLRVLLAMDFSLTADAAAQWVNALHRSGPCEVIAAHVYWPPEEFARLGLGGARSYLDPDPQVTMMLTHDLEQRLHAAPGARPRAMRIEPHIGSVGERVAEIASEENVDLVVVGTHDRGGIARLWEGSVSRGVLRHACVSVVCVPAPPVALARPTRPIRSVLCATDFSADGDAAIELAYSVVDRGGVVHLVHVVPTHVPDPMAPRDVLSPTGAEPGARETAETELRRRIPSDAIAQRKSSRVHVLGSNAPGEAIRQAAERLDVDLVCVGTHGRTGLRKLVLGSVSQDVLHETRRPVLLARGLVE